MARGYSAEDMHKLLGGNLLRVFREVQAAADHNP
jgi:membrane dipeptidase